MSPPPPPPPPSSGEETLLHQAQHANTNMYTTPPQRQAKTYGYGYSYGYLARRRTSNAGTLDAHKSPASSPATSASSAASPSHHFHKTKSASELLSPRVRGRMDPYPRYSPRKRLSADFSDGTYSGESGTDSPKSEKGWRIHAAVNGPFLTGPLAKDFGTRVDDLLSPRGKKKEDQDFANTGLLLFPIVPDYVAPAITPEVFQASIQPQTQPQVEQQPQPEPDHSAVASQQNNACYYPENTSYSQQPTETPVAEAAWDASAQQQQYYQDEHQQYYQPTAEDQQYYQSQQYYQGSAEEQQYYQATAEEQAAYYYNNGGYDQQQYDAANYGYEQSYEQYPAVSTEQPAAEPVAAVESPAPPSSDEFPPLPHHEATPAVVAEVNESVAAEQSTEPAPAAPQSLMQRPRAPSYAEIVSGAAHTSPRKSKVEAPKTEASKPTKKVSYNAFNQLSEGIAESMTRILAKSKDSKASHAEVEFMCVIRRIQTQLKLMGKVTNNLHLEQVKTLHKLQKSEIEKLSMESANAKLQEKVLQLEQEQQELKQQLAAALEAKDYLVKNQTGESSAKPLVTKNNSGRQSGGSWKSVALYSLVACAASLSGVWVGINYADDIQHFATSQPIALEEAAVEAILSQITEEAPASYASQIVEIIEPEAVAEVVVAPVKPVVDAAVTEVVEMEVAADLSSAAAVVDFVEAPAVSNNWNAVVEVAVAEPVIAEVAEVVESIPEVAETAPEVIETAAEVVEIAAEVVEVVEEVVIPAQVVETVVAQVAEVVVVEATPRAVAADVCKPFVQALYSWCPSLFDMPADEKTNQPTESASPLNGLARALGSLSSRILSENAPVAVEEAPVEEVTVQVQTPALPMDIEPVSAVEDVSGSVIASVDAEAVVETVEVAAVESVEVEKVVVEYSNSTASVSFETSPVEALTFVAPSEEAPVVVEAVAEAPAVEEAARSRWAMEQFLVEAGASCGLAADVVIEAFAVKSRVEEVVEIVEAAVVEPVAEVVSSEWFVLEEPLTFTQHSNASAPVVTADEVVETEMIEKTVVDVSESEESSLEMCSAPVFDLKSQLLTAL